MEEDKDGRSQIQNFLTTMDREISSPTAIIFATLQDAILCIRNDGSPVNEIILRIYERHAAFFQNRDEEILIEHPEVNNVEG